MGMVDVGVFGQLAVQQVKEVTQGEMMVHLQSKNGSGFSG